MDEGREGGREGVVWRKRRRERKREGYEVGLGGDGEEEGEDWRWVGRGWVGDREGVGEIEVGEIGNWGNRLGK